MKSTITANFISHFCQPFHLHSKYSSTISQSDSQLNNLQTDCVAIINSTFNTNFTEIIPIKNSDHKEEMMFKKQLIIRVFFDEFRVSENSFIRTYNEQTNQRDFLNIENISQYLTEISQLNRTHSTKPDKFFKFNSDKLYLFNIKKFSVS